MLSMVVSGECKGSEREAPESKLRQNLNFATYLPEVTLVTSFQVFILLSEKL